MYKHVVPVMKCRTRSNQSVEGGDDSPKTKCPDASWHHSSWAGQGTVNHSGMTRQGTMNRSDLIRHYESDQSEQQDCLSIMIFGALMRTLL